MALQTATAELRTALGLGTNSTSPIVYDEVDVGVQRLGAAVAARIEEYAPDAPQVAKDEGVVRGAAWLKDTLGAVSSHTVGPLSVERPANTAAWFLHSGAASLLTRWKTRRAGVI